MEEVGKKHEYDDRKQEKSCFLLKYNLQRKKINDLVSIRYCTFIDVCLSLSFDHSVFSFSFNVKRTFKVKLRHYNVHFM